MQELFLVTHWFRTSCDKKHGCLLNSYILTILTIGKLVTSDVKIECFWFYGIYLLLLFLYNNSQSQDYCCFYLYHFIYCSFLGSKLASLFWFWSNINWNQLPIYYLKKQKQIAQQVSRVRVPACGHFPILSPSLSHFAFCTLINKGIKCQKQNKK